MTILCLDTATDEGTVAVVRDDGTVSSVRWRSVGRHGEHLFGYIEQCMAEAGCSRDELSVIGVNIGPGKFTSLRVGLGTAKGLALGLNLPIVAVSSLRVLARTIDCDASYVRVPVMTAYRGDVFAAAYLVGDLGVEELTTPLFGSPEHVFGRVREAIGDRPLALGGEGVGPHAAILEAVLGPRAGNLDRSLNASTPGALVAEVRHVMRTTGPAHLDSLEPCYLRASDAKLPMGARGTGQSG
ncbi:MAG: tRNA (adenosine(37)-N6)-threonylcarbamoyltransferase complex dimerization subunit type 1 TsaB [Polyangiales bacterium]